jgi:hypothetical protein
MVNGSMYCKFIVLPLIKRNKNKNKKKKKEKRTPLHWSGN